MESDDAIFSNLPDPTGTGGWAPAAQLAFGKMRQQFPQQAGFIDALSNLTPNQVYSQGAFGGQDSEFIKNQILDAHTRDIALTQLASEGHPYAPNRLRELRGQPPQPLPPGVDPDMLAKTPLSVKGTSQDPNAPQWPTARDYQRISGVQPASMTLTPQPWQRGPPPTPPFPANINRSPGPPPGTTLNTNNVVRGFFPPSVVTHPGGGGLMNQEEMLQRLREGFTPPQD